MAKTVIETAQVNLEVMNKERFETTAIDNNTFYIVTDGKTPADQVSFDNADTGLTATTVQDAIVEAAASGGGASLPDQTGNKGKFLATDGATASWSDDLYISSSSVRIGNTNKSIANSVSIGNLAAVPGVNSVAIGSMATADFSSVAVGYHAGASATNTIQLGFGTNATSNTFQVWGHTLLNRTTGQIPTARISTNDSTATAGQVLTKTDTGAEWQDAAAGGDFDDIVLPRIQDAIISDINLIQYTTDANQLRIKAGSEFLYPNGAGVFTRVEAADDIVITVRPDHEQMLYTDATAEHIYYIDESNTFCGPTAPTAYTYMLWYDTANNQVKYTGDGGATWQSGFCMPFAIGDQDGISKCFCTGMGYMANCMWVMEGMAVSIPNGKKPDSTFNNDKYVLDHTIVQVFDNTASGQVALNNQGQLIFSSVFEVTPENFTYDALGNRVSACRLADYEVVTGRVTLSDMRKPVQLATQEDLADFEVGTATQLNELRTDLENKIDIAATSGDIVGQYWFGVTKAITTIPNPTNAEQNYYNFVTGSIYRAKSDLSGWDYVDSYQPPLDEDIQIVITSKFWDIEEQEDQQGGNAIWSHINRRWGYFPKIVKFLDATSSQKGVMKLYSATGQNTDGTMTQKALTDALATKQPTGSYVTTNTDQTITGTKWFERGTGSSAESVYLHGLITKTTNTMVDVLPYTAQHMYPLEVRDAGNSFLGYIESAMGTDGTHQIKIASSTAKTAGGTNICAVTIEAKKDGTTAVYAPGSDKLGSILTTAGITKGLPGYVKFGNGLIIQWGYTGKLTAGSSTTINFPTPFSGQHTYYLAFSGASAGSSINWEGGARRTVSSFVLKTQYENYVDWIAIGY